MGTNIHCFVEEKMYRTGINETDRTGKWISIDKWTKSSWAILYPERDEGPIWKVERKDMVFTERNYDLLQFWLISGIARICLISVIRAGYLKTLVQRFRFKL